MSVNMVCCDTRYATVADSMGHTCKVETWEARELFGTLCLAFGPVDTLCGATVNPNAEVIIITNISVEITCDKCATIAHNFKIPTA
jgi:hypothetical protein